MTETVRIHSGTDLDNALALAVETLNIGGVVLYPTDTTYALAVNALNAGAVDRVFQLKGRDYSKPIHVVVRDMNQAEHHVIVNDIARQIGAHFLPGALTLVLPQKANSKIPTLLVAGANTLGIRIPNHPVCRSLTSLLDFPITTTSANRSGMPNTYSIKAVGQQLGADFKTIDVVLDTGQLETGNVSTVIAVEGESIKLIREGTIPFANIMDFLNHRSRKV